MLVQLKISDFAVIKDLSLTFRPGLNILSGETGAGKSILITALNLVLGARASADLIRTGSEEARVEALFSLPDHPELHERLEALGIEGRGELVIKRTLSRQGRNRISINGSLATLQILGKLSPLLISISGQHENQALLNPDNHLLVLDEFAGLVDERRAFAARYGQYRELKERVRRIEEQIRAAAEREELARFQIREIDQAGVEPGEDEALTEERHRLKHAAELLQMAQEGCESLYESPGSAFSQVSQVLGRLEKGAAIDSRLKPVHELLAAVEGQLEDVAYSLRDFQRHISLDPQRLEAVEERLVLLHRLKRKYGPTLEDVLERRRRLEEGLETQDSRKEALESLMRDQQALEKELRERCQSLSRARRQACSKLESALERELRQLHMPHTRFQVAWQQVDDADHWRPEGADRAEFMISPNPGEALRPLVRIASGGELSRVMLAMKTILARQGTVETLVFDEVDAGIGGAAAEVVGRKLVNLSRFHQVICITHLPQIASQGPTHYLVRKSVAAGRTETAISELNPEQRVEEIARLLAGRRITAQARAHARELLAAKQAEPIA